MFYISAKGIFAGVALLLVVIITTAVAVNVLGIDPTIGVLYPIYLAAWIAPGYVAGRVAGKGGVANGALVGFVVALMGGGIVQVFFNSPPPGAESSGGLTIFLVVAFASVILCGLGGLFWEIQRHVQNKNL